MGVRIVIRDAAVHLLAPAIAGGAGCVALVQEGHEAAGLVLALGGTLCSLGLTWGDRLRGREAIRDRDAQLQAALTGGGFQDAESGLGTLARLEVEWMRQLARFQRRGERFSLVVLDFKTDRPEVAPAEFLRAAGSKVELVARSEDTFYRLADRRIGVLLSGSDYTGAVAFVLRARHDIVSVTLPSGEVLPVRFEADIVDWREGLEHFPAERVTAEDLLHFTPRMFTRWASQRASADETRAA